MQHLSFVSSPPDALFGIHALRQHPDGMSGRMSLGEWARGPDDQVAVGSLGVLVDNVLGYALMRSVPHGWWSISTEIWIDLVGDLPGPEGVLTARSRSIQQGSFAAGQVFDSAGRVVVECRQRGRAIVAGDMERDQRRDVAERSGSPGLASLLGVRPEGDGHLLEASPSLLNPRRMLHGGVSLAASEVVATRSRLDSGCRLRTSSVHIVHTRGVPPGSTVVFHPETRHAGRTLWVTEVIGTVDGKVCTVATITA